MGTLEIFALPTDEGTLLQLLQDCFEAWEEISFGPLIQGAAWEIQAPQQPTITMRDGYATLDFGAWHCHICIGTTTGEGSVPTSARLQVHRRCRYAELYRRLKEGVPNGWALRLRNGHGEEQITIHLPHPFLTAADEIATAPDWSRLQLWDGLRRKYLGLGPDPFDQTAGGFVHG